MNKKILTIAVYTALVLPLPVLARDRTPIGEQIVDVNTGQTMVLIPENSTIPIIDLGTQQPQQVTGIPNIDIPKEIKIKYWNCDHGKCNPIELLIINSINFKLIDLDNVLNEGWNFLLKNYPNTPILQTRLTWVNQRDNIANQALENGSTKEQVEVWLIHQYEVRINSIASLNLIPEQ